MSNSTKITVNGLSCTAFPVGGGLYAAVPDSLDNLGQFLTSIFSGKLDVQFGQTAAPTRQYQDESITQYRHRTGLSRTQLADRLNISRRTLGRWEASGKRMSEVN